MKYSYYPGCTLKDKAKQLDLYARLSAKELGFELEEIDNWQCCGGVYPLGSDEIAKKLPSVRALAAARDKGQKLLCLCSACYNVIKRVNNDMKTDSDFNTKVNNYLALEKPYNGECEVVHYLEVLRDEVGFDNLKKTVKNPLTDQKIGAYYGCLLLRPGNVMQFDDPEDPVIMEEFIKAMGATPVIYADRNECCGGYVSLLEPDLSNFTRNAVLESAVDQGAECLITACPLCRYNLDKANKIKVYYFSFNQIIILIKLL